MASRTPCEIGAVAAIEGARPFLADTVERHGELILDDEIAGRRIEQSPLRGAIALEPGAMDLRRTRQSRRHAHAETGDADRRLQHAVEGETAMAFERRAPRIDHARHGDAGAAIGGDAAELLRRRTGPVHGEYLAARLTDEAEHVAAEAAGIGRDDGQHRLRRDHRIDGAAAQSENLLGRRRGERIGGGDGAGPPGQHRPFARGEGIADQGVGRALGFCIQDRDSVRSDSAAAI